MYRLARGDHPEWDEFRQAMVDQRRVVATLARLPRLRAARSLSRPTGRRTADPPARTGPVQTGQESPVQALPSETDCPGVEVR